jgi:hypothetical protein
MKLFTFAEVVSISAQDVVAGRPRETARMTTSRAGFS